MFRSSGTLADLAHFTAMKFGGYQAIDNQVGRVAGFTSQNQVENSNVA